MLKFILRRGGRREFPREKGGCRWHLFSLARTRLVVELRCFRRGWLQWLPFVLRILFNPTERKYECFHRKASTEFGRFPGFSVSTVYSRGISACGIRSGTMISCTTDAHILSVMAGGTFAQLGTIWYSSDAFVYAFCAIANEEQLVIIFVRFTVHRSRHQV